jgi:NAD(P)-dependent dehydrogenase (short-subunit alcohol dehydrogenase family)
MSGLDRPLEGQVALVTGVRGNLGPVWAAALAGAGATVVALDLSSDPIADDAVAAIECADVTDGAAVRAACERLAAQFGVPHVLVNNAGMDSPPRPGSGAEVADVPLDDFCRVLEVNLAGAFAVTQVVGSVMVREGRGSIVNIGSLYASVAPEPAFYDHFEQPFLKPPAYGASKAGLINLTRYLARAWGPHGVRVNALSPGGVLGGQDDEFKRKFKARVPLRRLAEPADLAGPLLFLASDASRYVTGQELRVDGGFTA